MAGAAHPEAMAPHTKPKTRSAPPRMPASWWSAPRIRTYLLFGATGFSYLLMGLLVLRLAWALGRGEQAWQAALASLSHPLYIAFHALVLVSLLFVGLRAFGKMMPKMQPRGGPLPTLPAPAVRGVLYSVWAALTLFVSLALSGVLFR